MQTFQYKHYDKDNNFIQVISPKIISSDIRFTTQINGGLGSLFMQLKLDFKDNNFSHGDIIKVNVVNEEIVETVWDDTDTWDDSQTWQELTTSVIGSIETIKPWQLIRIQNISTPIEGVVNKIRYSKNYVTVTLNKVDNFIKLL